MPSTAHAAARRRLALGLCVTMIATACTGDDDPSPSTTVSATTTTVFERDNDGVVKIGAYLPLTGAGAAFGPPMMSELGDAVDVINAQGGLLGADVELIQRDEGAVPMEDLLAEEVDAIIGPASSTLALSVLGPAVDSKTGVVVCSPMATALALDDFPDNKFLFRTAPSDSLQMRTIANEAVATGAQRVSVGYLDDPYGRGLAAAFDDAMAGRVEITLSGFGADQDDLSDVAGELLENDPAVVVVLGDADDGSRLLAALDDPTREPPVVLINDSIRQARAVIQGLSSDFRERLTGHAPRSGLAPTVEDGPEGFFVPHAVDCLNLIALAIKVSDSDDPSVFRGQMASVSREGGRCSDYVSCAAAIEGGFGIDYSGFSGPVDLSPVSGDPTKALFDTFQFNIDGNEVPGPSPIETEVR